MLNLFNPFKSNPRQTPIQKLDKKSLSQAIDTALEHWTTLPNSDELLQETGKSRQEMLNVVMIDDEVLACREDLYTAILAHPWRIWGDGVDEATINELYKLVRRHAKELALLVILAKFNGYAVAEYLYAQDSTGRLWVDKILSKDGELDFYQPQRDGQVVCTKVTPEVIINDTIKHLVLKSKATPIRPMGEMMIVRAYPAVAMRRRGWGYLGQFIARYAQPYVIGKQGGFGDVGVLTRNLFGFVNGGALGVGADDEVALHQLTGGGEPFELVERLANQKIQKLILGRAKTSELASSSRAAQETDDDVRQDRIAGYLDLMQTAVQHLLDAVLQANAQFGLPIHAPKGVQFEYVSQTAVDVERAERDKIYSDSGLIRFTKEYFLNIVGYEESHFEMLPMLNPQNQAVNTLLSWQLSQAKDNDKTGQDDDTPLPKDLTKAEQAKLDAIIKLLEQSKDYDDFANKIAGLNLPDELIQTLADELAQSYQAGLKGGNHDH